MAKPDRKPPKKSTRSLRGKGPTPKAEDRPYHKKYKSKEESKRKRTERKRIDSKRGAKGDRKFSQRRDFRRNEREHVDTVAGRNAVLEALRAGIPAKELILAVGVDVDERLNESIRLAQKMAIGIKEVERRAIENMTGIANHQGIALVVKPFQYSSQKEIFARAKDPALFIAVDGVTDPRNIGAIARSAAAFSADGLLIPERRNASLTAAAWKSSAGAAARLPIAQITNLARSVEDAKSYGCFIVGLDGDADTSVEAMEIADQPLYLIVGSEGKGLSRLIREKCDLLVSIPMSSAVESLNASVAVSIALYAVDRKRAIS
ncbi:MAG: 23S rRNA (guanosine(2251)-2'-O)-methyltransferase RlmB [Actinobacteria bacterium]|nr:23S rRNA (guanosine(2251)-2'-O)-methyltransferase RlmB [Actinomycetota bacterium]NCZ72881.1 23S rRNA (guanosine(2251)-2'-O)-methyltransferase RlmB [Actinomycetota bacterium]NDE27170.1 23S rRNA (guanosine(2251)-2'-O)-methyltransferase RlmB [Actinomycetota bacterium]NDE36863.1 23S rRNA (guanosine(2251)-2'-O)-methyltransferase RlmB [Actinomycetota bacterium]